MRFFLVKLKRLAGSGSLKRLKYVFGLVFYDVEGMRRDLESMATCMIRETTVINLRPPIVSNFSGQAYRDSRGIRMIDIHPAAAAQGADKFYLIVLHEIAHHFFHVLKDAKRVPITEDMYRAKGAYIELNSEEDASYSTDPQEKEAESFTEQIDHYAIGKAFSKFGSTGIKMRIRVLKETTFEK